MDAYDHIFAINNDNAILLEEALNSKKNVKDVETEILYRKQKNQFIGNSKNILEVDGTSLSNSDVNIASTSHVISEFLPVQPVLQGDHPWCGAACTAAIINYKNEESLTAEDVTIEVHGSAVEEGITNSEAIEVASNHGLTATETSPMSYTAVAFDISNDHPIYMQMQRTKSDGTKSYHALVLRGYENYINYGEKIYSVINPWYNYYVEITGCDDGSQVTYITGSRIYKWYKTVRGF